MTYVDYRSSSVIHDCMLSGKSARIHYAATIFFMHFSMQNGTVVLCAWMDYVTHAWVMHIHTICPRHNYTAAALVNLSGLVPRSHVVPRSHARGPRAAR
jgi:hypothetical protein